jgi:hypothetical protein
LKSSSFPSTSAPEPQGLSSLLLPVHQIRGEIIQHCYHLRDKRPR